MAELILSRVGAAAGSRLLPNGIAALGAKLTGAAIGRTLGGLAGRALDARFLTPAVEGPRIHEFHVTEGREGAPVPIVYGRMRVGAQLIWAAEFKERRETHSGKGGPRINDYSYTLSFAVALGEGVVSRVARCWANGEPFDLSKATWRFYPGDEAQTPDPLIEAVEGANAPAFRGAAYVVFEDLPVDAFGARLPQLSFEIVRPAGAGAGALEQAVRAINLIPGAGEFALATTVVRRFIGPGRESAENQHGAEAMPDFIASLDQLEAELPNARRVNLVVGWFGDDLRCGVCRIRSGVDAAEKETRPLVWSVAGRARNEAHPVSSTDGRANFGGTPSDETVRQAIRELKARGYHVTLYPFVFMDLPAGNGRDDPYGGEEQAAFPWRGRITCHPAPGRPATADGTSTARAQVEAFFEREDGYHNFIRHYSGLAAQEGVDGFLIGSELIGLTRVRDESGAYPAVERLCALAADVRAELGTDVELTYAADWTEYGAHVLANGDVRFPLDALWAQPAISHVGLDWYAPLADWRNGEAHADAVFDGPYDPAYLTANIEGGEAFDWYYADDAARAVQERTPITDGAFGEPWIFRQKDIRSWWSNAHHERTGGVRMEAPTPWTPGMKPIRFVEFGCPAADKGSNQPNVFYDPKSSESALPHFSNGERDDLIQRRAIESFISYWADDAQRSEVYDGPMAPNDGMAVWAWDARPFPAFPANIDAWSDGGNWRLGHWLNGRTGLAQLSDVIADICARAGVTADAQKAVGVAGGYRIDGPISARTALEPLMTAFDLVAVEHEAGVRFGAPGPAALIRAEQVVDEEEAVAASLEQSGLEDVPAQVRVAYISNAPDFASAIAIASDASSASIIDVEAPLVMDASAAKALAGDLEARLEARDKAIELALPLEHQKIEAGDRITYLGETYRIESVSDGPVRRLKGWREPSTRHGGPRGPEPESARPAPHGVEPDIVVVDAPPLPGQEDDPRPLAFAYSDPWPGPVFVSAGGDASLLKMRGRLERPCQMGRLLSPLAPAPSGRWIEQSIDVEAPGDGPFAGTDLAVLNGANAALVEAEDGWELVQFRQADLLGASLYRLSGFLRGQQGSEPEAASVKPPGARILFLTGAETRLEFLDSERGAKLIVKAWRERPEEEWAWSDVHEFRPRVDRMWSPGHIRLELAGAGTAISWVRRARKGGDPWIEGEPPVEVPERYRVRILSTEGVELRRWETASPFAVYETAHLAEDLASHAELWVGIAQLGRDGLPGSEALASISGSIG